MSGNGQDEETISAGVLATDGRVGARWTDSGAMLETGGRPD